MLSVTTAQAEDAALPGTGTLLTKQGFEALVKHVEAAIQKNQMGLVAQASASRGAAGRGIEIPRNAVRMLQASVPAGVEAPLRLYLTKNADGTASLSYRTPSAVFAPHKSPRLDEMAKEPDTIFERIARDAAGG